MNDTTGKTSSCLAITEKRPHHKPGGCVGIFFQLFDWNRRLAKKKLFSKKLLPPVRPKQASKKFGGDEKMPMAKLLLIADENSGGFPNVKKNGNHCRVDVEQKHEMRAPGLVARLMGLESMPAVHRDNKLKKASFSENYDGREEKFGSDHCGSDKEDLNLEKGLTKHELRPQKVQKTGPFERRAVTRFGGEALQFKSVLSRSRKHHPKLASPVKSPRVLSGRNRLIDAATKILEPGLQATNRAKCALTYSNSMRPPPADDVMIEGTTVLSPDFSNQSSYYASAAKSLKGQSSCKNCGNFLDVVDLRSNEAGQASVFTSSSSNFVNASCQGSGRSMPRPPVSSLQQAKENQEDLHLLVKKSHRDVVFQKSQDQPTSLASQAKENVPARGEPVMDRKPPSREGQGQWHLSSQPRRLQKDVPSSIGFKHRTQKQNQMSLGRNRVPPRSKLSSLQSGKVSAAVNTVNENKDFVALNRSLSGRIRPRMPTKVDNCKFEAERKSCNRPDDSLSPVRKRRTMNVNRQFESTGLVNSTCGRQRNARCNVMTGKVMGLNAHSMNRTCVGSRLASQGEVNRTDGNKNIDVISFTFNSPMKDRTGVPKEMEQRRDPNDFIGNSSSQQKIIISDETGGKTSIKKQLPLRGDALGVLLEQKLKELTCQEEDEFATGGTPPKRTTAMILQELISALTADSQDDGAVGSNQGNNLCYGGHMLNKNIAFQAKPKAAGPSVGLSCDSDHRSPGSVLEASFSNDSCFSSSLEDSSGHKLHLESMDCCSYDKPQALGPEADLLDSATSLNKGRTGSEVVNGLLNHVSEVLCSINLAEAGLKGSKLAHAKEVILNAELFFGNSALHNSDGMKDFLIGPFLLDEMETLAIAMWGTNSNCFLGFEDTKDENQLGGFLFDCVIECLDSKCGQYCKSGFKAWTRLRLCMNTEMLIREVVEEVRRWTDLGGKCPDEIIERDMSHSLGKWTDFEIEAFESGADIGGDIFQILVDEIVTDLWECRMGSS